MLAELTFSCILSLLGGRQPASTQCDTHYVRQIAHAVDGAHELFPNVPAEVIVAVMRRESSFKQYAIGIYGEVGLMQIKRGGAVQGDWRKFSDRQLSDVTLNVFVGTGYLSKFAGRCSKSRARWLTPFNGGRCVPSTYSESVLSALRSAKARSPS